MKITQDELYDLVRCSAWLTHDPDDVKNFDREEMVEERRKRKLIKKLQKLYNENDKDSFEIK